MRRSSSLRYALAMVVGLCGGIVSLAPVNAGGVSDQERTVQQVLAEIDRMHQKVDQYNEDIVVALDEKAQLDAQIVVAEQKIAEQQTQLDQLEVQLAGVAVAKVTGGGSGALGPLFADPVALDESLQRDHLARVAVNAAAATSDDYEVLLADFNDLQDALEDDRNQAAALAEQAEQSRVKATQALEDLEAREVAEKAKLGDLLQQEEDRQAAAAAAEYKRQVDKANAEAAQAQAAQTSQAGSSGSGGSSGSNNAAASAAAPSSGSTSGATSSGATSSAATSSAATSSAATSSGSSSSGSGAAEAPSSGGGSVPPVSSRASVAVNAASSQMGVPYRFATSNPGVSFDCSGLTAYAWGTAGVGLPHQSGQQFASTPHVPKEQAQPGDLIFYYSPISHVGIYIGGGRMVHAPATGKTVSVTTVRWDRVVGVSRPG